MAIVPVYLLSFFLFVPNQHRNIAMLHVPYDISVTYPVNCRSSSPDCDSQWKFYCTVIIQSNTLIWYFVLQTYNIIVGNPVTPNLVAMPVKRVQSTLPTRMLVL